MPPNSVTRMRNTKESGEPEGVQPAPLGTTGPAADPAVADTVDEEERDSLWKDGIEARFRTFNECFFPVLAAHVDWDHAVHFLEQELRPGRPRGSRSRRHVDVVARVREVAPAETDGLLHVEVQGQRRPTYERQVHHYRAGLVARHNLPVASAVLQTDRSPTWRVGAFRQRFLGVPLEDPITTTKLCDWDDRREELERSSNEWALVHLAFLASLPRTRRGADLSSAAPLWATKAELTARLAACNLTDKEFQALFRLIDSYLRLSIADEEQFMAELQRQMGETEMPYLTGIERVALQRGEEIGLQRGEEIGLRRAVLVSLETRFGPVPVQLVRLINSIVRPDTLAQLIPTTLRVSDLEAFSAEVNSLRQALSNGAARVESAP